MNFPSELCRIVSVVTMVSEPSSFVLFCKLSGSFSVFGLLEFYKGVSSWESLHSLFRACGLNTGVPLQLWEIAFVLFL